MENVDRRGGPLLSSSSSFIERAPNRRARAGANVSVSESTRTMFSYGDSEPGTSRVLCEGKDRKRSYDADLMREQENRDRGQSKAKEQKVTFIMRKKQLEFPSTITDTPPIGQKTLCEGYTTAILRWESFSPDIKNHRHHDTDEKP